MGSFCCNYISYYHWSSLLFGICLADILWICQKAFTEWAPPVCLYQMCCILNFHWISSRYFHKIPLNPHPFPTHKCYWKCHNIFTTSWLALRIWEGEKIGEKIKTIASMGKRGLACQLKLSFYCPKTQVLCCSKPFYFQNGLWKLLPFWRG